VYDGHTIDDDSSGQSVGNGDGIVNCGETIELYVDLRNQGVDSATGVGATISSSDPYVTWSWNTASAYPDIPGGGTATNSNDFDFELDPGAPDGHVIHFDLSIEAASGGPWTDSFEIPVTCNSNNPPYLPAYPSPADGASGVSITALLAWSGGDPDLDDTVTYDVYFEADDTTPDALICSNVATTVCDPGPLTYNTHYYWYVVATDNHGASTTGSTWDFITEPAPQVGPLVYDGHSVDDDSLDQSDGNGDGIVNCGEAIELWVDLRNEGADSASGVQATISSSDPYVTWTWNTGSGYADISGGGSATNINDFDLEVAPGTPHGHVIQFELDITASNGGPWTDSFDIPVSCCTSGCQRMHLPLVMREFMVVESYDWQFNGSAPGWGFHSGTWWFENSAWLTTDGDPGQFASASYSANFASVDYEALLRRSGCETCANALILRGTPYPLDGDSYWNRSYVFQYSRDGYYSVWKTDAGNAVALQSWAFSSAIKQGTEWNLLRVVADGSHLEFHINDTLVWTGSDAAIVSGRVGIGMYRSPDTTGDKLLADWATLSTPAIRTRSDRMSSEQGALNEAANRLGGGSIGYAPPGD
jgi:hypothetical protein